MIWCGWVHIQSVWATEMFETRGKKKHARTYTHVGTFSNKHIVREKVRVNKRDRDYNLLMEQDWDKHCSSPGTHREISSRAWLDRGRQSNKQWQSGAERRSEWNIKMSNMKLVSVGSVTQKVSVVAEAVVLKRLVPYKNTCRVAILTLIMHAERNAEW